MVVAARGLSGFLGIPLPGLESTLEVGVKKAVILADQEKCLQRILLAKPATKAGFAVVNVSRLAQLRKVDVGPWLLTVPAKVDVIVLDAEMY